jgi:hypothetical protein
MTKEEFRELFLKNVRLALADAKRQVDIPLSSEFDIELHGGGVPGEIITLERAVDVMYLGENLFYPFIDIGVVAVTKGRPRIFVRITGYPPSAFDLTWNTPKGNGPFRVLGAASNLRVED